MKKIIALLLALVLTVSLVACSQAPAETPTDPPASNNDNTPSNETNPPAVQEFSYPMEGNPTVTVWQKLFAAAEVSFEQMEDTPFAQELMKRTGVNIDYIHPSTTDAFTLMLAEQDYPDILPAKGSEVQPFYADGVIIPLNDVIDQYMPNYKAYLEAHPDIAEAITDDEGNMFYIPTPLWEDEALGNTNGIYVRQDMLDELGIAMPETIDEWHDALVAIKDKYGIAPIAAFLNDILRIGAFENAYAPSMQNSYYSVDDNGDVFYVPATDDYKAFLTVMAQWYKEGLINPDIASMDNTMIAAAMGASEAAVSYGYIGSGLQKITGVGRETNPDFTLVAVATPALEAGATPRYRSGGAIVTPSKGGTCISTKCENVEAAARYLDYFWTEEGYMLANFGIEGTSYTMVDGVPTYTDWILNNPDGLAVNAAMAHYMIAYESFPGLQSLNYLKGYYSNLPQAAEAMGIYASKGELDNSILFVSHTLEESDELTVIEADLKTYFLECATKFVLGTMDIETQWDEFVENLNKYGLDDALEIKQAAYDRYLAK